MHPPLTILQHMQTRHFNLLGSIQCSALGFKQDIAVLPLGWPEQAQNHCLLTVNLKWLYFCTHINTFLIYSQSTKALDHTACRLIRSVIYQNGQFSILIWCALSSCINPSWTLGTFVSLQSKANTNVTCKFHPVFKLTPPRNLVVSTCMTSRTRSLGGGLGMSQSVKWPVRNSS